MSIDIRLLFIAIGISLLVGAVFISPFLALVLELVLEPAKNLFRIETFDFRLQFNRGGFGKRFRNHASCLNQVSDVVGTISHDLNTPLSVLMMRIDQVEEEIKEGHFDPQMALEALNSMSTTVSRMEKMINQFQFLHYDENHPDQQLEFSILDLVKSSERISRNFLKKRNLHIHVESKLSGDKDRVVAQGPMIFDLISTFLKCALDLLQNETVTLEIALHGEAISIALKRTVNSESRPRRASFGELKRLVRRNHGQLFVSFEESFLKMELLIPKNRETHHSRLAA